MVSPCVMEMCETFCPPYTSDPVLVNPVIGMIALEIGAVDGIVSVSIAPEVPAPTMLAVTPDWLNELRFCIKTAN